SHGRLPRLSGCAARPSPRASAGRRHHRVAAPPGGVDTSARTLSLPGRAPAGVVADLRAGHATIQNWNRRCCAWNLAYRHASRRHRASGSRMSNDDPLTAGSGMPEILTVPGQAPGPVLALLGGVHGDELEGVLAARRIVRYLRQTPFRGTLRVAA